MMFEGLLDRLLNGGIPAGGLLQPPPGLPPELPPELQPQPQQQPRLPSFLETAAPQVPMGGLVPERPFSGDTPRDTPMGAEELKQLAEQQAKTGGNRAIMPPPEFGPPMPTKGPGSFSAAPRPQEPVGLNPAAAASNPVLSAQAQAAAPASDPSSGASGLPQPPAGVAPMGLPSGLPTGGIAGPSSLFGGGRSGSLLANPLFLMGMGLLSGKNMSEGWQNALHGLMAAQPHIDKERDRERDLRAFESLTPPGGATNAPSIEAPADGGGGAPPSAQDLRNASLRNAASRGRGGAPSERPFTPNPELASAVQASAQRLGISPKDLATVISYETGGTFDPSIRGGAGRRHIGLIQFGPNEQAQYGASQNQSVAEQMGAVERYLKDRGLKPGMGLMDLYSTINAGRPGRFGASDAGNGGAPGTVADKVNYQMAGHQKKADMLLASLGGAVPAQTQASAPVPGAAGQVASNDPSVVPAAPAPAPAPASAPAPALAGPASVAASDGTMPAAPAETAAAIQPVGTGAGSETKAAQRQMAKTGAPTVSGPPNDSGQRKLIDPVSKFEIVGGGTSAADNQKARALWQKGLDLMRNGGEGARELGKQYLAQAQKADPHRVLRDPESGSLFRQSLTDLTDYKRIEGTERKVHSLGEGAQLRDNQGRLIAENPKAEKDDRPALVREAEIAQANPALKQQMIDLKRSGAQNINVGGGSDKQIFDTIEGSFKEAQSAARGLTSIAEARKAVEAGGIFGAGADVRLGIAKLGTLLGLSNGDEVVNAETFKAAIAPQVGAMLKSTVGSTQISEGDRKFAEKAAGGNADLDERSIKRLLTVMEKGNNLILDEHQRRVDAVYDDPEKFKRERALFSVVKPKAEARAAPGGRPSPSDPFGLR